MNRPPDETVDHLCENEDCGKPIKVTLSYWTEDNFKTWTRDTFKTIALIERFCATCQEEHHARRERIEAIESRYPRFAPSDFDPTIAGEVWDDSEECVG